jgi:hypothetical protein
MAGHVLGLNPQPSAQFDLDTDLQKAMDYVRAKQLSAEWTDINRNALDKFRRFLLHERGQVESHIHPYNPAPHTEGIPAWLWSSTPLPALKQRNWLGAHRRGIPDFHSSPLSRFLVTHQTRTDDSKAPIFTLH